MQVVRKNSSDMRKETKTKRKVFRERNKYPKVHLICIVCKQPYEIRTSNVAMYTEDVKKNWICLLCPDPKRKGK